MIYQGVGVTELEKPTRVVHLPKKNSSGEPALSEKNEGTELLPEPEAKRKKSCLESCSCHLVGTVVFCSELQLSLQPTLSNPAGRGPRRTITLPYFPCTSGLLPSLPIGQTHLAARGQWSQMRQPLQVGPPGHRAQWRRVETESGRGDGLSNRCYGAAGDVSLCGSRELMFNITQQEF